MVRAPFEQPCSSARSVPKLSLDVRIRHGKPSASGPAKSVVGPAKSVVPVIF